jgi:hypothetical protein
MRRKIPDGPPHAMRGPLQRKASIPSAVSPMKFSRSGHDSTSKTSGASGSNWWWLEGGFQNPQLRWLREPEESAGNEHTTDGAEGCTNRQKSIRRQAAGPQRDESRNPVVGYSRFEGLLMGGRPGEAVALRGFMLAA